MGDAGPSLPAFGEDGTQQREVTVLVTGFGPFKTFTTNPSHLITTQLTRILLPTPDPTSSSSSPTPSQPIIHLFIHPEPLRVSYPTISTTIPTLLSTYQPDYILHLGMAAGRRHYSLETLAHRDGYTIKDIDNIDGVDVGSRRWTADGCPAILDVAWDTVDVLNRWRHELKIEGGHHTTTKKPATIPDVRLSSDPGRFLCDFIFYQSLSERWKEAQLASSYPSSSVQPAVETAVDLPAQASTIPPSHSRQGKVAFLHVPGDTDQAAIDRGARITEAAIRALVSSWEEGYRRLGRAVGDVSVRRRVGVEFDG